MELDIVLNGVDDCDSARHSPVHGLLLHLLLFLMLLSHIGFFKPN